MENRRLTAYLAAPNASLTGHIANALDMALLVSFAHYSDALVDYMVAAPHLLIDSGAYSENSTGEKIDIDAYKDFVAEWLPKSDACAGLDDISGDWKRSMRNYAYIPTTFPTFHSTDPEELLPELIAMARERNKWLAVSIKRPRGGHEEWLTRTLEKIPKDIHVHGFALWAYAYMKRLDSIDSTAWFRNAMKLKIMPETKHLTYSECLEITIKRIKRWTPEKVTTVGLM